MQTSEANLGADSFFEALTRGNHRAGPTESHPLVGTVKH